MRLLKYLFPVLFPLFTAQAQENISGQLLSGKVEDALDSRPITWASITFKYQKERAISDENGHFIIGYNGEEDSLIISSVGYQRKAVIIRGSVSAPIIFKMEKIPGQLDEVVINTGFQTIPRERATGSFSFIDKKTLNLQTGTDILGRLNGVANSVLFDNTKNTTGNRKLNINIRGLSTINGSQDPLIIVDNFPYEQDLSNINPDDVESVTILKDAAASSIWGSRAGNGVIVITTKKGKYNQPFKVDFNTNVQVGEKPDLYAIPQMDIGDFIDVEEMLFAKGAYNSQINANYFPALSPAVEIFLQRKKGLISAEDSAIAINKLKGHDVRDDYYRYVYSNPVSQVYSLNLSGGTSQYNYLLSGGYTSKLSDLGQQGRRINLNLANTYRPLKNLEISVSGSFVSNHSKSGKAGYSGTGYRVGDRSIPYIQLVDQNGVPLRVAGNYRQSFIDTVGGGKLLAWDFYPLKEAEHNVAHTYLQSLTGALNIRYSLLKSLSVNVIYRYENETISTRQVSDMDSYTTRNLINTFTQIDPLSGVVSYIVPKGGILNSSSASFASQNFRTQFNFSHDWKHKKVAAIFGSEIRQSKSASSSKRLYGYNDELLTFQDIDPVNAYPSIINGQKQYISAGDSRLTGALNRYVSLFANAAFTLQDKYTFSGSVRKDASNLFGVNSNDKWLPFWSTGIGWDLSSEDFYNFGLIPYIKVRASYGASGIVDQSKSAVTVIGYSVNSAYTGTPQALITQYANNDLSWEKVKQFNLGVDFQIKNQIVTGTVEYYVKKGFDLFGASPIDYTAGLTTNALTKNVADMKGRGWDLSFQTTNINRGFKWLTSFLLNYNVSITTRYYIPKGFLYSPSSGRDISPIIGKSLYAVSSYKWGGLDAQGNPQGYLGKDLTTDYLGISNSLTSFDNLIYNGPSVPKYFGSIGNTLTYKGFTLSLNVTYKLGYYFRKSTISYDQLVGSGIGHPDFSKRWQQPGDELTTTVPAFVYPISSAVRRGNAFYAASEVTALRGDHVRLQFANLSYDLKNLLGRSKIKQLEVYLLASNLGILWRQNKEGLDPDFLTTWPTPRTYTLGLRTTF